MFGLLHSMWLISGINILQLIYYNRKKTQLDWFYIYCVYINCLTESLASVQYCKEVCEIVITRILALKVNAWPVTFSMHHVELCKQPHFWCSKSVNALISWEPPRLISYWCFKMLTTNCQIRECHVYRAQRVFNKVLVRIPGLLSLINMPRLL